MQEPRVAAVMLPIFADPPHDVVFIERAAHLRYHPGQIGLPGGASDPVDGDDVTKTALRELYEELGVAPERVTIVGALKPIVQRSGRFVVTAVVGVLEASTLLVIDHTETAGYFTVPLGEILKPGAVHEEYKDLGEEQIVTNVLNYDDRHIWGLTGRILRQFSEEWDNPRSQLRAELERVLNKR
jgi:8-oxo-dGTP pyrophosphatase MutT (NUDIX family)